MGGGEYPHSCQCKRGKTFIVYDINTQRIVTLEISWILILIFGVRVIIEIDILFKNRYQGFHIYNAFLGT